MLFRFQVHMENGRESQWVKDRIGQSRLCLILRPETTGAGGQIEATLYHSAMINPPE